MKNFMLSIFIALVALFCGQSLVASPMASHSDINSANISLDERANAGDVKAMYELSVQKLDVPLAKGVRFFSNNKLESAFYWANKAYENGSIEAMVRIACFYENGIILKKDLDKALELYTKAVEAGNLEAKLRLAMFYTPLASNKAGQKYADEAKAKALIADFLKVVQARDDLDIKFYNYAIRACLGGNLCEKDIEKAVSIIEKVHKQNDAKPIYDHMLNTFSEAMIFCYIRGIGVEKDKEKALAIYNKRQEVYSSSNAGFIAYELGLFEPSSAKDYSALARSYHFSSVGGTFNLLYEGNEEKSKEFYEKSGEMGYHLAYHHLALEYFYDKDYEKSFALFNKGLEGIGDRPEGDEITLILYLARSYKEGKGTEKNIVKAVDLYEQVARLGNTSACFDLGFMYFEGEDLAQDYKKALGYLLRAEKTFKGEPICRVIAECYEKQGEILLAIDYYKKARDCSSPKGELNAKIKELSDNIGLEIVVAEKLAPLDERANAGDVAAMYELAKGYLNFTSTTSITYGGEGSEKSGFYWYEKAYENGSVEAIYPLARCYDSASGTARNEKRALELYNEAREKGDASALLVLVIKGENKFLSIFFDYTKSKKYQELLKVAMQRDDLDLEIYAYIAKNFLNKNSSEAIPFLEKIVKNSELSNQAKSYIANAYIALAYCYATATLSEKNEAKAIELINTLGENIPYIMSTNAYIFVANLLGLYDLRTEKDFYAVAAAYDSNSNAFPFATKLFVKDKKKANKFYEQAKKLRSSDSKKPLWR